ncbi:hypothetical protein ACR78F_20690 [Sphingobacterium spiritivorum]|uniref:hypothetical protein n=1 Tax=Sphingobacterium spiritivorum TaxID=258 RepID=UPI003DA6BA2A
MNRLFIIVLLLLLTAANIIILPFLYKNIYYTVYKTSLDKKYELPNAVILDNWNYDISNDNYGIVFTDTLGGVILHRGMSITENSSRTITQLKSFEILNDAIIVYAILDNKESANIKINRDHSVEIIRSNLENSHPHLINLQDSELIRWLDYKNTYHPNVLLFFFGFLLSLSVNVYLVRRVISFLNSTN